jgi:hypothetical protein
MARRKFIVFAVLTIVPSLTFALGGLLAADLYAHHRAERSAGLNVWGYRGPLAGRKRPGEVRAVMLGGSTVFGYGSPWYEAIPALLEQELDRDNEPARRSLAPRLRSRPAERESKGGGGGRWKVINLGFNNEGAYAFLPTLQDFAWLDADLVLLYEGYNDVMAGGEPNLSVHRHESPVFRLTGYFPILPALLDEKRLSLQFGGDLEAAYAATRRREGDPPIVFRPSFAARTGAAALNTALKVGESLSRQLDRIAKEPHEPGRPAGEAGCSGRWVPYCDSVYRAVRYALDQGQRVLVVGQPRMADEGPRRVHESQQQALAAMIAQHFGHDSRVRYVDLGDTVDLNDTNLSYDKMHLSVDGNRVVARALVAPVQALAR